MTFEMKLFARSFELIKTKRKTIEMRLNDEKRKKLKVDDVICFENVDTKEKLYCRVVKLYHFDNFEELYKALPKKALGYQEDEEADPSDMLKYYSSEQIDACGVLGIEVLAFESARAMRIHNTVKVLRNFAKENLDEKPQKEVEDALKGE